MTINPDEIILLAVGPQSFNATINFTWLVIALLTGAWWLITRRFSAGPALSRWQNLLGILTTGIRDQIAQVSRQDPGPFLPFVGTLFIFIAMANLLNAVPGYLAPTGSLSMTTALSLCVFVEVPLYRIAREGPTAYLRHHVRPTWLMLPRCHPQKSSEMI